MSGPVSPAEGGMDWATELEEASGSIRKDLSSLDLEDTTEPPEPSTSGTKAPLPGSTKQRRSRPSKGKKKVGTDVPAAGDKVKRQAKSYVVSDNDISLYSTKHRVSDKMFGHYLSKRIGYECTRVKRRLNRSEVKKLFPAVRTLCLEILSQVKAKKVMNREKRAVMESIQKATNSQLRWADIVKGRKAVPPTEKSLVVAARDAKIKKQTAEINSLKQKLKSKEDEVKRLASLVANLTDRVKCLEDKERQRKAKDPYHDKKQLAAKGKAYCDLCLPPSVFVYKKPLLTPVPTKHFQNLITCDNCSKRDIYLSAGTGVPIASFKKGGRVDGHWYPEGFIKHTQFRSECERASDGTHTLPNEFEIFERFANAINQTEREASGSGKKRRSDY